MQQAWIPVICTENYNYDYHCDNYSLKQCVVKISNNKNSKSNRQINKPKSEQSQPDDLLCNQQEKRITFDSPKSLFGFWENEETKTSTRTEPQQFSIFYPFIFRKQTEKQHKIKIQNIETCLYCVRFLENQTEEKIENPTRRKWCSRSVRFRGLVLK